MCIFEKEHRKWPILRKARRLVKRFQLLIQGTLIIAWLQDSNIKITLCDLDWKLATVSNNLAFTHLASQSLGIKMKSQSWSLEEPSTGDMIVAGEIPTCSSNGSQGTEEAPGWSQSLDPWISRTDLWEEVIFQNNLNEARNLHDWEWELEEAC